MCLKCATYFEILQLGINVSPLSLQKKARESRIMICAGGSCKWQKRISRLMDPGTGRGLPPTNPTPSTPDWGNHRRVTPTPHTNHLALYLAIWPWIPTPCHPPDPKTRPDPRHVRLYAGAAYDCESGSPKAFHMQKKSMDTAKISFGHGDHWHTQHSWRWRLHGWNMCIVEQD